MVDSSVVLAGQTAAYTFYVLMMMSATARFAYRVKRPGGGGGPRRPPVWKAGPSAVVAARLVVGLQGPTR